MVGRPPLNLAGVKKGKLLISHRVGLRGNAPLWAVRCDCGTETEMSSSQLRGATISCGCHRKAAIGDRVRKHGKAQTGELRSRIYKIWAGMKARCGNPNAVNYARYGGRGIKVCDRWQKFDDFYADMGDPPTNQHTLDRIDNDKGYEPGNCRWATYKEQAANQYHSPERGRKASDISGQRFGRLTAVERVGTKGGYPLWRTRCDCGNEQDVAVNLLTRGTTRSCGCLRSETTRAHIKAVNAR